MPTRIARYPAPIHQPRSAAPQLRGRWLEARGDGADGLRLGLVLRLCLGGQVLEPHDRRVIWLGLEHPRCLGVVDVSYSHLRALRPAEQGIDPEEGCDVSLLGGDRRTWRTAEISPCSRRCRNRARPTWKHYSPTPRVCALQHANAMVLYIVLCDSVGLAEQLSNLRKRRRSVRPAEIDALLRQAGFVRRQGKGDHWVYTHRRRPFPLTIDPRNPLLPVYVGKAIRAIEEVLDADEDA